MKKLTRITAGLLTAALLVSCASPYQAQMQAVHNSYMTGNMSEGEYRERMKDLSIADAGWQQEQANAANTAAVVGVAAIAAAAIADGHHHHRGHWHRGHWHRRHWH